MTMGGHNSHRHRPIIQCHTTAINSSLLHTLCTAPV